MQPLEAILLLGIGAYLYMTGGSGSHGGTPALPRDQVAQLVHAINVNEFGDWFDDADVLAIIEIESGFFPRAYRAEPQLGDASRGLMQLLLSTARDRGYDGAPDGLFDPETNIRLGMAQLQWIWSYLDQRGAASVDNWIAAYNAGVGNVVKGYRNLDYVARWRAARARWLAS